MTPFFYLQTMKKWILLLFLPAIALAQKEKPLSKITLGSCSKESLPELQMWDEINAEESDLWIWLGDIIYGDSDHIDTLRTKYERQKSHPGYQQLIAETPVIGIWDDHDYGVNDGDRTYPHKRASRDLLFEFLDYPEDHPDREHEGAYQSYTYGPDGQQVRIILLDGRYFRDPLGHANRDAGQRYYQDPEGQLLGEAQWKWFEDQIKNSPAEVNIVVCGIQFISAEHPYEKWSNFPMERERLFKLLRASRPEGLVLVSGDRHIGEFSMMLVEEDYPVYEMTTSGLSHTWDKEYEEENPYRIERVISRNYGVIEIDWTNEDPQVNLQLKGPEGVTLSETEIK